MFFLPSAAGVLKGGQSHLSIKLQLGYSGSGRQGKTRLVSVKELQLAASLLHKHIHNHNRITSSRQNKELLFSFLLSQVSQLSPYTLFPIILIPVSLHSPDQTR